MLLNINMYLQKNINQYMNELRVKISNLAGKAIDKPQVLHIQLLLTISILVKANEILFKYHLKL